MRLSLRLILSLIGGVTAVAMVFAVFQAGTEMQAEKVEVQRQALVLAESQQRLVEPLLQNNAYDDLQAVTDRFQHHQRLAGMAVYDATGKPLAITPGLASRLTATPASVTQALNGEWGRGEFFRAGGEPMHVFSLLLRAGNGVIGAVAIVHDIGYIGARRAAILERALTAVAAQTLLIAGITILIVRWSLGKPMQKMAQWLRDLRTGGASLAGELPNEEIFQPLATEV